MTTWFIPTTDTKFQIDLDWWEESGRDFRLILRDQLCSECQQRFPDHRDTEMVDWVDPETGEVQRTDALWQCLSRMCADQPDYIHPRMSLVMAIFRALLKNNNSPLSPVELHEQYMPWKMPGVILRTLAAGRVHLGLRPVQPDQD
jgi:hypothetical protein